MYSAVSRSVFEGKVPVCTVAPPGPSPALSITATFLPKYAAAAAAFSPAGPPPITTRSYAAIRGSVHLRVAARKPRRRNKPALAIRAARDRGGEVAIPQPTGHLLVLLIQTFAVVGRLAAADLFAAPEPHFQEPIRIGEALSRGGDDVAVTA